jgi:hypothetical protein
LAKEELMPANISNKNFFASSAPEMNIWSTFTVTTPYTTPAAINVGGVYYDFLFSNIGGIVSTNPTVNTDPTGTVNASFWFVPANDVPLPSPQPANVAIPTNPGPTLTAFVFDSSLDLPGAETALFVATEVDNTGTEVSLGSGVPFPADTVVINAPFSDGLTRTPGERNIFSYWVDLGIPFFGVIGSGGVIPPAYAGLTFPAGRQDWYLAVYGAAPPPPTTPEQCFETAQSVINLSESSDAYMPAAEKAGVTNYLNACLLNNMISPSEYESAMQALSQITTLPPDPE